MGESSALRVSKHWNMMLNSLPKLWIHLDLSKANKPNVSLKSIQAFLRRSHWRLTRASLVNLQPVDFPRLMAGLRQIPSLEHLELLGSFSSKFDVAPVYTLTGLRTLVCSASSEMTLAHFRKVLLDCPLLERVEVYIKPAPFSDVETFPAKLPNLRSLIILGIDYPRYSNDPSTLNLPFPTNVFHPRVLVPSQALILSVGYFIWYNPEPGRVLPHLQLRYDKKCTRSF